MEERIPQGDVDSGARPTATHAVPQAGYPDSVHAAVNIAAPLLAGGAIVITGVIAADEEKFRWPGATMLLLILAIASLIASIQLGFRARRYHFSSEQLDVWVANTDAAGRYRIEANRAWAIGNARNTWRIKVRPAVYAYDLGTVLLGLALAAALMPTPTSEQPNYRWAAAAFALTAALAESTWSWALTMVRKVRPAPPRSEPNPLPELVQPPGDDTGAESKKHRSDQRDA